MEYDTELTSGSAVAGGRVLRRWRAGKSCCSRGSIAMQDRLNERLSRALLRCTEHGLAVIAIDINVRENGRFDSRWTTCCEAPGRQAKASVKDRCLDCGGGKTARESHARRCSCAPEGVGFLAGEIDAPTTSIVWPSATLFGTGA